MEVPSSQSLLSRIISKLFYHQSKKKHQTDGPSEFEVINNLEEYFNTTIREVMVPRTQMVTVDSNATLKNAIQLFRKTGYSRLPVQEGIRDNIVGFLYAIDLFEHFENSDHILVAQVMRKPSFVSYSQKIHQVFAHFRNKKVQLAIVVDEHGGVDGLVTIEDVIEELVGDIPDEFDKNDDPTYTSLENGSVLMDANFPLSQFNELFNKDFQKEGIETIGGYVCHSAGKILEKGDKIELENLQLTIDESNDRRLEKLIISASDT